MSVVPRTEEQAHSGTAKRLGIERLDNLQTWNVCLAQVDAPYVEMAVDGPHQIEYRTQCARISHAELGVRTLPEARSVANRDLGHQAFSRSRRTNLRPVA